MSDSLVSAYPPIVTDYPAPGGGERGPTSLELFLVSLCTCVSLSVAGTMDAGTVTVTVHKDCLIKGMPLSIQAGSTGEEFSIAFESGPWSFEASSDAAARGELYLSIRDR